MTYSPPKLKIDLQAPETIGNLAAKMTASDRRVLADHLCDLIAIDEQSMGPWLANARRYLQQIKNTASRSKQGNQEQRGSEESDQSSPGTGLTLSAIVQFAARATDALLGEPQLFKASKSGGEALAEWTSDQFLTDDPVWTLETDQLVIHMAATGLAWRKRKYESEDKKIYSKFLPCTHVIVNSGMRTVERTPRMTEEFERYPYEIDRSIERGHWVDYQPRYDEQDPQASMKFYETDCWLDFDNDGINEPWTVTIALDDMKEVVKIEPRWSSKTVVDNKEELFFKPVPRYFPYVFLPDPDGGFLPMGFGWLLENPENTANDLLASIIDTAKSEAENGGVMVGGGVGVPDSVEIKTDRVNVLPGDRPLNDTYQSFPVKSVSSGSVAVLEKVITLGDRIAGTLNLLENAPASMSATLAKGIIDNGSQVQSAVHRRMVQQLTGEGKAHVRMADMYDLLPQAILAGDTGTIAVTADPQLATEMHRSALAGIYFQMLDQAEKGVPWQLPEIQLRLCQVLRLPNPEKLIGQAKPQEATPAERLKGAIDMHKASTARIQTIGKVAVDLTSALKNIVEAQGGMQGNQMALLQMAQLEETVKQLMTESQNAGSGFAGLDQPPGNAGGAPGLPGPQQGGGGPLPVGGGGGDGAGAGAGGGLA